MKYFFWLEHAKQQGPSLQEEPTLYNENHVAGSVIHPDSRFHSSGFLLTFEVFLKAFCADGSAWAMTGYQNILMRGLGLESAWMPTLILLAYALGFFALAVWRFSKMDV